MAAVKTARGGPRLETQFAVTSCAVCSADILKLGEAYRVKSLEYNGAKRSTAMRWQHRKCTDAGVKK